MVFVCLHFCCVFGKGTKWQFFVWNKSALCVHNLFGGLTFTVFTIDLLQRLPRNESDGVRENTQKEAIEKQRSISN